MTENIPSAEIAKICGKNKSAICEIVQTKEMCVLFRSQAGSFRQKHGRQLRKAAWPQGSHLKVQFLRAYSRETASGLIPGEG